MAVNFAELIDFMHHNNVILCDINRDNILYDKDLVAYLVDLDSDRLQTISGIIQAMWGFQNSDHLNISMMMIFLSAGKSR